MPTASVLFSLLFYSPNQPTTKYGGVYTVGHSSLHHLTSLTPPLQVTLIPGDGIGAEITDSVKEIFEYVNAPIEWEQYDVLGMSSAGEALFKQAMESLKRNRVGLKGAFGLASGGSSLNLTFDLRHSLYPHLSVRSHFMECRHAPTTRHLCFSSPLQVIARLSN